MLSDLSSASPKLKHWNPCPDDMTKGQGGWEFCARFVWAQLGLMLKLLSYHKDIILFLRLEFILKGFYIVF